MSELHQHGNLKRAAIWLVVALALWAAGGAIQHHTPVEIYSDGGRVEVTVAGSTVTAPIAIESLDRIEITAMDSVFPPGGRAIALAQGNRSIFADSLPRRFSLPEGRLAPLGDWELDGWAGEGLVYERKVDVAGPFTLRATFTGRSHNHLFIALRGTPDVTVTFRHGLINNDIFVWDDDGVAVAVTSIDPEPLPDTLAAASTLTRVIAAAAVLIALFTALAALPFPGRRQPNTAVRSNEWPALIVAIGLGAGAFGLSAWVAWDVLEALPHFPDSVVYLMQAKWLLSGHLFQEVLPIQDHLSVPFTYVVNGNWLAHYPVGWPLFLAIGEKLGRSWLVAPALGGAYIIVLFLLGRELYSRWVGVAAALLAVVSPLACLLFSSMLSHAASSFLIVLYLWLLLVARRIASPWPALLAGIALGLAFGVRPVGAVAIGLPSMVFLLLDLRPEGRTGGTRRVLAGAVGGGIVGAIPVLVSNFLVTGLPLSFPYSLAKGSMYGIENLPFGLRNMDALLASTLPALYGWGWGYWPVGLLTALPLALAAVPFILRCHTRHDLLLLSCGIAIVLIHLGARAHGLHGFGPRYYFDAFFAVYLLTARGFQELARLGTRSHAIPSLAPTGSSTFVLAAALFAALNLSAATALPERLRLYRGYNRVDSSLRQAIQAEGVDRALIVFGETNWRNWAMASPLMAADPCSDFAFAQDLEDNSVLFDFYSDRAAYLWLAGRLTLLHEAYGGLGSSDEVKK